MSKLNRASQSDAKITKALKAMSERYSYDEFKPWCGANIANEFRLGAAFAMVLSKLGVIETKHGLVKLNKKINHLRPSTVRKRINEYVNEARPKKAKKTKQPVLPIPQSAIGFDELVIALKAKLKQEVMSELLQSLK